MALSLQQPAMVDRTSEKAPAVRSALATEGAELVNADSATRQGRSAMMVGLGVMAASILGVLALTMVMMLVLTDVSVLAAFGVGLYCAFWLGIGFGTIFASAAVFGSEH